MGKVDPSGEIIRSVRRYWESLKAAAPPWWRFGSRYAYWGRCRTYLQTAMILIAAEYSRNRNVWRWEYAELRDQIEATGSLTEGFWLYFERCRHDESYNWFRRRVKRSAILAAVRFGDMVSYANMAVGFIQQASIAGIRQAYLLPSGWWK